MGVKHERSRAPLETARAAERLLWVAGEILELVPRLRATAAVADLAGLRAQTDGLLRDFQARGLSEGIEASRVAQALTVLTALIDHVVTSMPWGAEAAAGERRPLPRLMEVARAAKSDRDLRELVAVALALGFGRGSGAEEEEVERIRLQLAKVDAWPSADGRGFSAAWQTSVARRRALVGWLPLWVSSAIAAALLAVLFFAVELSLAATSDRLAFRLAALRVATHRAPPALPAAAARVTDALKAQMAERRLWARDEIDRSVILIPDGPLFDAGAATLRPGANEVLRPIVAALQAQPGRIRIIGHTDGTLLPSARYPSEWELSVDRARGVRDAFQGLGIDPARLAFDGTGATEPVTPDAAPVSNGRIEIVLLASR